MTTQTILNLIRVARLVGITSSYFSKTVSKPKKYCFWCEKKTRHRVAGSDELLFIRCDDCHLTQPLSPLGLIAVDQGGPTVIEFLITTALASGPDSLLPAPINTSYEPIPVTVNLQQALSSLSALSSEPDFFDPLMCRLWQCFEYFSTLISFRNSEEAINLALLNRIDEYGQMVSTRWQQWQHSSLKTWFRKLAKSPSTMPISRTGRSAYIFLRETSETELKSAVTLAVTREAGWFSLLVLFFNALDRFEDKM